MTNWVRVLTQRYIHIPDICAVWFCKIGPQNPSSTAFRLNENIAVINRKSRITLWCCNSSSKQAELIWRDDQESRWKRCLLHIRNRPTFRNEGSQETYMALIPNEFGGWFCRYSIKILWLSIRVVVGLDTRVSPSEKINWLTIDSIPGSNSPLSEIDTSCILKDTVELLGLGSIPWVVGIQLKVWSALLRSRASILGYNDFQFRWSIIADSAKLKHRVIYVTCLRSSRWPQRKYWK